MSELTELRVPRILSELGTEYLRCLGKVIFKVCDPYLYGKAMMKTIVGSTSTRTQNNFFLLISLIFLDCLQHMFPFESILAEVFHWKNSANSKYPIDIVCLHDPPASLRCGLALARVDLLLNTHLSEVNGVNKTRAKFSLLWLSLVFDWALFRTIDVDQRCGKTESERYQRLLAMTIWTGYVGSTLINVYGFE